MNPVDRLRALSIRQPWAHAILHLGKDIENRTWRTEFRGPVLIHAAKAWGPDQRADITDIELITGAELQIEKPLLGGIVGRAKIVDCVEHSDSPWFFGRYGFVIEDAEPLDFIPCRGALGFFRPTLSREAVSDLSGDAQMRLSFENSGGL